MKILLLGYYGYANFGDEWILAEVSEAIRAAFPEVDITVISGNPHATEMLHGLSAVSRTPAALRRAIAQADVLVCGGGSLLQDTTSTRSLFYYLSIIGYAALIGKKVILWGQGVGPLHHKQLHPLIQQVLNKSSLITLRDKHSLDLLHQLGVDRPVMLQTADPSFGESVFHYNILEVTEPTLTLVLRDWPGKGRDWLYPVAQAIADFSRQRYWEVAICSFQPEQDRAVAAIVQRHLTTLGVAASVVPDWERLEDISAIFARSSLVVAGRYHAMALAAVLGVPVVGLGYDPKVSALAEQLRVSVLGWDDLKTKTEAALEAGEMADAERVQLLAEKARGSQEAFVKVILAGAKGE